MQTMKLEDFVSNTMKGILKGISDAQDDQEIGMFVASKAIGGVKFPPNSGVVHEALLIATSVQFDISVTIEEGENAKGGGGFEIGVARAQVGAGLSSNNVQTSRIQFSVPIILPRPEKSLPHSR